MALYDAFVSYSHAKDKPIAAALQSVVQKLGKPWYRRRALRVFRDDTSLSATPHLWPTIEQALGQSRYLILLASPEAAASHWVNKEIAYWLRAKSADTLLIAVTNGTLAWDNAANDFAWDANTPLPPALKGRFAAEPKWVDLTAYRDGADKRDAKFTELAADFAAAIRGMPKEDLLSQEVRQQRRALTLAWSAAASLLLLAGAAGVAGILAYRAQQDAIAQRNRAEQTLAAATNTANSLIFDLAQGFRDRGVPAALVKDILDRAGALQQQLTSSGQTTPELARSEAAALVETVTTLLAIGDTDGALASAKRANDITQRLVSIDPANTIWQRDLAINESKIGDVLLRQGKLDEALAAYRNGLAIQERLARNRSNAQWQRDLSSSDSKIGIVLMREGRLDEALAVFRDGLAIVKTLAEQDTGNPEWQRDLALFNSSVGDVLMVQAKLDEALAAYREARSISKALVERDESNTAWQHDLSIRDDEIGDVLREQGKLDEALAVYREGLVIRKALAEQDKTNTQWQRDLSGSDQRIGLVLVAQGRLDEALAAYRDGLALSKAVAERDKSNAEWQRDLSIAYDSMGDALKAQGKLDEAIVAYREGLAIAQALVERDKSNMQWQRDLAFGNDHIGDVLVEQGKPDEALVAYREGLAIRKALAEWDKSNIQWQRDVSIRENVIGDVLADQGKLDDALAIYREALAIRKALVEADQSNPLLQHDLAVSDQRIGDVLKAQGKLDEALAAYRESLDIDKTLAERDRSLRAQLELLGNNDRIGNVLRSLGRYEDVLQSLQSSLTIIRSLADRDAGNPKWPRQLRTTLTTAGNLLLDLGKPDAALALLDEAAQLPPETPSPDRARAALYAGRLDIAIEEMTKANKGAPRDAYSVIWLHIARLRAGQQDGDELASHAKPLDHTKWPWPVVALFLGALNSDAVLAAAAESDQATRNDESCEADFYVGVYQAEKGAVVEARRLLQSAAEKCPHGFIEQAAAGFELKRLDDLAASDAKP
jgi:tetratricopeptide (TPR) repeat protein